MVININLDLTVRNVPKFLEQYKRNSIINQMNDYKLVYKCRHLFSVLL